MKRPYQVQIQYVEAVVTYAVNANSKDKAAELGVECWGETCTGIEDGRVLPGDKIGGIGRFVSYVRGPSIVVTPISDAA